MESVTVVIDRIMAVADERSYTERKGSGEGEGHSQFWQKRPEVGHPGELTRKQRGEMAEAAFVAKAAGFGFAVSKPWGESSRYDLIVDVEGRLVRVQVKSAHRAGEYGGYTFHAHGNTYKPYRASEIDVLVAYVVPEDAWYVFPVAVFRKYRAMKLFPSSRRRRSKFEKFREAWDWLKRKKKKKQKTRSGER
jgi:hypothetical protein